MNSEKKYHKTKNILIILLLLLLLVFVSLICYILVYSKLHPKKEYLSPDEIAIKTMLVDEFELNADKQLYTEVSSSNEFFVNNNDEEKLLLKVVNGKVKISREDKEEDIEILLGDQNINNSIKLIYQTQKDSLILTRNGDLYTLISDSIEENNILKVEKKNINFYVKNIVEMIVSTDSTYVMSRDNRLLNIDTLEEYTGIIKELVMDNGTMYVYDDYTFSLEKGKIFTNENGEKLRFNILFDNKVIDSNNVIYEIDFQNKTITTSSFGSFMKIGYGKDKGQDYNINIETTTGIYRDIKSEYYYTR